MKKMCLLVGIFLIIMSCATTTAIAKKSSGKPNWVENPKSAFPESRYLIGIGEGSRKNDAENNAMANLSKIFESKVKVDQSMTESYKEIMTLEGGSFTEETNMNKNINIQSNQTLLNVKYSESHVNLRGQVMVVAYMDRIETGDIYQERINENNQRIMSLQQKANSSSDNVEKYGYFYAAQAIASMNDVMIAQLDIISSTMKGLVEKNYDRDVISRKLAEIGKKITFSINISGDTNNMMKSALSDFITKQGFTISTNAIYNLVGEINIAEADLQRKQKFARWSINMDIKEKGKTVISYQQNGREGHLNIDEAKARAFRKMKGKIEKDIARKLKQYFQKYNY